MNTFSYVLATPYTIAKSRIGGVLSRLLSRLDLDLVGAQMITPDEDFVKEYAAQIRRQDQGSRSSGGDLLADYALKNFSPSGGRRHRMLLLLFKGENPCRKLSDICGALFPENRSVESLTGETIRDTYADLITDSGDPKKVIYFEPAVLSPRRQEHADENLALFARYLERNPANIVSNMEYPDPARIQRTLVIIKPDNWKYASSRPGTIIDMFSRTGLRIVGVKVHYFSLNQALEFYGPVEESLRAKLAPVFGAKARECLEKEFGLALSGETEAALAGSFGVEYARNEFWKIVEFMSGSRPDTAPPGQAGKPGAVRCMILVYEGEDAIKKIRDVLGPTDPLKAPGGTVRREFGQNVMINTAHASDSPESYEREKAIVRLDENTLGAEIGP